MDAMQNITRSTLVNISACGEVTLEGTSKPMTSVERNLDRKLFYLLEHGNFTRVNLV